MSRPSISLLVSVALGFGCVLVTTTTDATPSSQPTTARAAAKPTSRPSVRRAKPASRPAVKPSSRPSSKPTKKLVLRPGQPTMTDGFARVLPWDVGLDPRFVDRWVARARKADSDAFVILRDGKLVGDWYFGRKKGPIETMSVTKSLVNLAIGKLVDEGKIKSLETPVHTFFPGWPAWKRGVRAKITLKHILTHTSGLRSHRNTRKIYASKDFVKHALEGRAISPPGDRFRYNNRAVNLLAGIVKKASGMRLDHYMQKKIFGPMGIKPGAWSLDKVGNPHAMSGAKLTALDLAKIGEMMRLGGVFRGKRIVSRKWVKLSVTPHPHRLRRWGRHSHGLLWWLLPAPYTQRITQPLLQSWQKAGMSPGWLAKMQTLLGKSWHTPFGRYFEVRRQIRRVLKQTMGRDYLPFRRFIRRNRLKPFVRTYGKQAGFCAQGYLGQHLIVLPQARMVIVRQIRWRQGLQRRKTGMGLMSRQLAKAAFGPAKSPAHEALLQQLYVYGKLGQKFMGRPGEAQKRLLALLPSVMKHKSALVRDMGIWALAHMSWKAKKMRSLEERLLQQLKVESSKAVTHSIWGALGRLGSRPSASAGMALLTMKQGFLPTKRIVATSLGQIAARDPVLVDKLFTLFSRSKEWGVKRALANGLVAVGPSLVPKLLSILDNRKHPARSFAAKILVQLSLPDKQMVKFCLRLVRDRIWSIRREGRRKLVSMGARAKDAIPFIRAMMQRTRLSWQTKIWKMALDRIEGAVRYEKIRKASLLQKQKSALRKVPKKPTSRRLAPQSRTSIQRVPASNRKAPPARR